MWSVSTKCACLIPHLHICSHWLITRKVNIYCLPDSHISKLQRTQNSAARLVTRTRFSDHITPVLRDVHWLPVKFCIMYKILLLTYKCLHGAAPEYLTDLIQVYKPVRSLRSSCKQTFFQHQFVLPHVEIAIFV